MISWSSRKHGSIAHSTTEAEYIVARKQYGLENWFLGCLVTSLRRQWFTVIIKVA
jgi:hypothetical protein